MLQVRLVGPETCRRYEMMRELVLGEAAQAGIQIELIEESEAQKGTGAFEESVLMLVGTKMPR